MSKFLDPGINQMIPLFEREGFIICFTPEYEEDVTVYDHFVRECHWTQEQLEKIDGFKWFSAKVTAWREGKELAADYLGCCCYKTYEEFYTTKGSYFDGMVKNVLAEARVQTCLPL